jgi:predicted DNA-binding transcriptional regulator AlpA
MLPDNFVPDALVPDRLVAKELGVGLITLWRRTKDLKFGFPPAIKINGRNYRRRSDLEAFKHRMAEISSKREVV